MSMFQSILLAIGGLGMLLFGIKMMSTGLEAVAGEKLQSILKRATSNRFFAAGVGVLATLAITSSTAVSIITVGFVNAGLLNLTQAIGVLLGINVGTTFSAQLIAFRIDAYAPAFIFIGVVLYMFFKKRHIRNIGYVVLGFGLLFFSITVMGDALRVFRTHPAFVDTIAGITNPLLALLIGFLFTVAVQSSSAAIGLLVTLHLNDMPIPFLASVFIILGANIGTSVTALIASVPASRDSKRTALFHMTYDLIGCLVFGPIILIFPAILTWFQTTWAESARQVAMFHTLYNVATLSLLIPFVTPLAKLMKALIPIKPEEVREVHERKLIYLDTLIMQTPTLATINAHLEVTRMGKIANESLTLATEAFFERSEEKVNKVSENEKTLDFLHQEITAKLVEINNMSLSTGDAERIGAMFGILSNFEKIGDHAQNIAEYAATIIERGTKFSNAAIRELTELTALTLEATGIALDMYEHQNYSKLPQIETFEGKIDKLSTDFVKSHVKRLKSGKCKPRSGIIFIDMVNDLERTADQAEVVALTVLPDNKRIKGR